MQGARRVQRYRIYDAIASGGMATVHIARLASEGGFSKVVAVKVMHAHFAGNPDFRKMFLDEARTVARIRHANVVSTLDILEDGGELFLVMDYVHGPALSSVLAEIRDRKAAVPLRVAATLACDLLEGLSAAHEARAETGEPLCVVHRDVSPHNLLVASDGSARVMDFGIATAADRSYATKTGEVKGKAGYMPPEQARGERVDRRADVYAAGTVLFELLTGRTPFGGGTYSESLFRLMLEPVPSPRSLRDEVSAELEAIVLRSLSKEPRERFPTAREMADAIRESTPMATRTEVADWLREEMADFFTARDAILSRIASDPDGAASPIGHERNDEVTIAAVPVERVLAGPKVHGRARPVALALAIAGLLGAAVLFQVRRSPSVGAVPAASSVALLPAASARADPVASTAPPPATNADTDAAVAAPRSTTLPRRSPAPRGGTSPSVPVAPSASAKAPAPPTCCMKIADTWQRYSLRADCVDNCPAEMTK